MAQEPTPREIRSNLEMSRRIRDAAADAVIGAQAKVEKFEGFASAARGDVQEAQERLEDAKSLVAHWSALEADLDEMEAREARNGAVVEVHAGTTGGHGVASSRGSD